MCFLRNFLVFTFLCFPLFAQAQQVEVDTAIVFLADTSGSIKDPELNVIRRAHVEAIQDTDFLQAVSLGQNKSIVAAYVEYGSTAEVIVNWTFINNAITAKMFADAIPKPTDARCCKSDTRMEIALAKAEALFEALPLHARRRVVDVIGDEVSILTGILPVRERLLAMDVTINAMPLTMSVETYANPKQLHKYFTKVAGGPGSFVIDVDSIEHVPDVMRQKLIQELF